MNYVQSALGSFVETRRRNFDPSKRADLIELAYFKKNLKWKNGCPFYLEWPYADIVGMCMSKYTDKMLKQYA